MNSAVENFKHQVSFLNQTKPSKALLWVGGKSVEGAGEKTSVVFPWLGTANALQNNSFNVLLASNEQLEQAIENAKQAQEAWAKTPIKERSTILFQWRNEILNEIQILSQTVSAESGKLVSEAKAGLLKGVEVLEFALSLQNADSQGKMEVSRDVFCEYRREPLGVVAAITPFNFPAMVPMWMLPIAIVLGNAVIWKPSDKAMLTPLLLAKAAQKAGIPDGILNIVQGKKEIVDAILKHPDIQAVGFVGSTPIAKHIYAQAAATGKRVLALGGAKNHIILMPDANAELASRGITDSFTGCAGQRCMAASVLLEVKSEASSAIVSRVVENAKKMQLGVDMGSIISEESYIKLCAALSEAEKQGVLLLDGRKAKKPEGLENGFWLGPSIISQVNAKSVFACEELFGPILTIIQVKDLSEALQIENANPYGNAASVFTQTGQVAEKVAREAKAGMIGVNVGVPVPREPFSFGGIQDSKFGHGDITGYTGVEFWSQLKKVTTKWPALSGAHTDKNWMS